MYKLSAKHHYMKVFVIFNKIYRRNQPSNLCESAIDIMVCIKLGFFKCEISVKKVSVSRFHVHKS